MPLPTKADLASKEASFAAERSTAAVRLGIIALGTVVYPFFLDKAGTDPALAYTLLAAAWLYGVSVLVTEPYRRYPLLLSSAYITVTDATFTTLWLYATGGWESPFYVALYVAVAGIAVRFGPRATVAASALYAASYVGLLAAMGELGPPGELAVRAGYVFFAGAIAALLAREVRQQARARAELGQRVEEAEKGEAKFRAVAEHANDAIVSADARGRIIYFNPAAEQAFGYAAEDVLGQPLTTLMPERFHATHRAGFRRFLETGESRVIGRTVELAGRRKDGEEFPLELSLATWSSSEGVFFTGIMRDIGERRRAESDRLASLERLKEVERLQDLDRFKTDFINTAAHELGTPLTPIKLQLHMLRAEPEQLSERQRKAVAILDRNVERLSTLVREVLEVARLQASRLGLERKPLDLNHVVLETMESFQEPARQAGLTLDLRTSPGIRVDADPKRLTQVLFNLLNNAWKFTPPGGRITVQTRVHDEMALVSVRDTGAGLRREDIAKLFQPFVQVHDTMQRTHGGTGLGLYICKGIVELHGGRVWAESPGPGKGATFTFALPLLGSGPSLRTPASPAEAPAEQRREDELARRAQELV